MIGSKLIGTTEAMLPPLSSSTIGTCWIVAACCLGGCEARDTEPGYEIVEPGPTVLLTADDPSEKIVVETCGNFRSKPALLTGTLSVSGVASGPQGVFQVAWSDDSEGDATKFGWDFPVAEFASEYPSPLLYLEDCPSVELVFSHEEPSSPIEIDYDIVLTIGEHQRASSAMLSVSRE